jgi:predicted AlkP superfamily phosphohydrolase/phosphomutase
MNDRTLLIGLDGATFPVLDPLMAAGVMPFLRSFLSGGARAQLRTIVPALTPPAWTSLMTGRRPGQHGVFDFFRFESLESRHLRFFTSHDIGCPTIWSLAAEAGLRVTSLNFPAMFPPPRLAGNIVPGWVPWRQLRLACWPENLFDRLKAIPGFNPREMAMDIKLEERATEGCSNEAEYGPWIELHIRRERNWLEILKFLMRNDPSPLTAILFDGVDKLQHLCWRFIRPEDDRALETEWEIKIRDLCLEYFRKLDGILEDLCAEMGPGATVIIASDHGFGPTSDVFYLNGWLEQKGYLAWADAARGQTNDSLLGVGKVARHTWLIDWTRTRAFAATPTSNGVHIVINHNGSGAGVPSAEYQGFRAKLVAELGELRNAAGDRMISEIWTREEAFDGPNSELAPDLTLVLRDGGLVSILPSPTAIGKRPSIAGAHRPLGVFAAHGPGITPGADLGTLSILDVAPLVLHSLALPIPAEMEGRVPDALYQPAHLNSHPVRKLPPARRSEPAPPAPAIAKMTPEDEQAVLERLRELGYLE